MFLTSEMFRLLKSWSPWGRGWWRARRPPPRRWRWWRTPSWRRCTLVFILLYIGCDWRKPGSNKGEDKHLVWLCHLWRGRVRRVPGCRHQPEESCHPFELKSSAGAGGDRLLLHVGHRHLPPARSPCLQVHQGRIESQDQEDHFSSREFWRLWRGLDVKMKTKRFV